MAQGVVSGLKIRENVVRSMICDLEMRLTAILLPKTPIDVTRALWNLRFGGCFCRDLKKLSRMGWALTDLPASFLSGTICAGRLEF